MIALFALTVFKCIRGMAPTYISDCITICNGVAIRDIRNSTSTNLVTLPYATLDIFKNSFAYRGPFIWRKEGRKEGTCLVDINNHNIE